MQSHKAQLGWAFIFARYLPMLDDNWEVVNGPAAHHIEGLNAINTVNVIEAMVTMLIDHKQKTADILIFNDQALCELHRTGTLFLLKRPGVYRDTPVIVQNTSTGDVLHRPPPHGEVPRWMSEFYEELKAQWMGGDALDVAAFALWRVNWVHPFKNGNGRTARAFAYACLCGHLGVILPGAPTVIDQIMVTRDEYEVCLRTGDKADEAGKRDLAPMKDYLNRLLQIQISSLATP